MREKKVKETKSFTSQEAAKLAESPAPAPQVGEIVSEEHKVYEQMFDSIISKHRDFAPIYFISIITKKDAFQPNVIRRRWVVRKSCPNPDWDQEIYSFNNNLSELRLEWTLPSFQDSLTIMKNKDIYDPQLVGFIQSFRDGKLKIPKYSP
jgi:hypothetical protein